MFGEADIMFEAASSLHEKMCEYFLLKEQCHEIKKLFGIVKKINRYTSNVADPKASQLDNTM